jgi:hypothetical protein
MFHVEHFLVSKPIISSHLTMLWFKVIGTTPKVNSS